VVTHDYIPPPPDRKRSRSTPATVSHKPNPNNPYTIA
jgi:hypothetical protein